MCSKGNNVLSRQENFSNNMNICFKMRRYVLLIKVKKLNTYLRCKFIILFTPNTNCHKTVSHVTTRPTHTVTFRSMHKHSYRHFNEDIHFVKYKNLRVLERRTVHIAIWIVKTSIEISIQTEKYLNTFRVIADPRRMALITQNASINRRRQIQ